MQWLWPVKHCVHCAGLDNETVEGDLDSFSFSVLICVLLQSSALSLIIFMHACMCMPCGLCVCGGEDLHCVLSFASDWLFIQAFLSERREMAKPSFSISDIPCWGLVGQGLFTAWEAGKSQTPFLCRPSPPPSPLPTLSGRRKMGGLHAFHAILFMKNKLEEWEFLWKFFSK